jgi:hypothetical protein
MANLHAMITSVLGMFVLLAQLLLASLLWLPIALVSLAKQRKRHVRFWPIADMGSAHVCS